MTNETSNNKVTLDDVRKKFKEYLYLDDTDMLEVMLATILSNRIEGTPIWMIFCGASGDKKSTTLKTSKRLDNVIKIDQLTKNTFASGKPNVWDLGSDLQNNSNVLMILDLASISSKNPDEKKEIFAQMRNLYDGVIYKLTGSGVRKEYENCHVTLIAGTIPHLKREYLIHQQLGSRELIFDTEAEIEDNGYKMDMAWANEDYEKQMEQALEQALTDFMKSAEVKPLNISDENKEFLKKQANKLAILRAVGSYNQITDELDTKVIPEVPTRLIKQFKRLWRCLASLDGDYPTDKMKRIIEHIVSSSGNENRQIVIDIFLDSELDKTFTIRDMRRESKLGQRACKREMELLWNLGILNQNPIFVSSKKEGNKRVAYDVVSYSLNREYWKKLCGE